MSPDEQYMPELKPYIRPQNVLKVSDITKMIRDLDYSIDKESNKKEANRLTDIQASLKCTLRVIDKYTTSGKVYR